MILRSIAGAILIGGVALAAIAQSTSISGPAEVIDGDTIRIAGSRIRLYGIDAPETAQLCSDADQHPYRCGLLAAAVLEQEIAGRPVTCAPIDTDRYGRTVASCSVGGRDLGDAMVRRGHAVEYQLYSDGRYQQAQKEAQAAKLGMWVGTFVLPETWRRGFRR